MTDEELLVRNCDYQLEQAGYHEKNARGNILTYLVTFSSGIAAAIPPSKIPISAGVVLVLLGLLGALFNYLSYQKFRWHYNRAKHFMKAINDLHPLATIDAIIENADNDWKERKRKNFTSPLRLYQLWIMLPLCTTLVGLLIILSKWLR